MLLFSLTVASIFSIANAEILPDHVDLKAAYCIPVLQEKSAYRVEKDWPEEIKQSLLQAIEKKQADLRRLRLYLIPRLSYLDLNSLAGARKSGEEDWARSLAEKDQCVKRASNLSDLQSCANSETSRRIQSCDDLSFMPF